MKFTPASTARSSIACEVPSSAPTPCMNEPASGSPNVIAPKHRFDTFTPLPPRLLYFMAGAYARDLRVGQRAARPRLSMGTPHRGHHVDRQLDAVQLARSQSDPETGSRPAIAGHHLHGPLRRVLRGREEAAGAGRAAGAAPLVQVAELHDLGDRHLAPG